MEFEAFTATELNKILSGHPGTTCVAIIRDVTQQMAQDIH